MNYSDEYSYWMALSHLSNWKIKDINKLIIEILFNRKISFAEFFSLSKAEITKEFELSEKKAEDISEVKSELPTYGFLAENLMEQGFEIIPLNSDKYSETLKQNLKVNQSPPLLYVKGNSNLLQEDSVAVVGSRKASGISLEFTRNIVRKCIENDEVVVSGFAKGVDKTALDSALEFNGKSIIVLPQGILTFGSGIKKYYKKIIKGDVLVLSAYHPKAPWSVGLAMNRNKYIYGLSKSIFAAQSDTRGGTWNGVIEGLKKGRKIFVRKPGPDEKNGNNALIMQGAVPVDLYGKTLEIEENAVEKEIKNILSKRFLTVKAIKNEINLDISVNDLRKLLANLDFVEKKKVKNVNHYYLKDSIPVQQSLFS